MSARGRRLAGLRGALVLTLLLALTGATARAGAKPAASTPAKPVSGLLNEPGYKPLVDPESSSVTLGRRLNAPLVQPPFRGGASSLAALGHAVCGALHVSSRDSLIRLCVTDAEFRDILWREFPQSRPVTGVQWEDAWRILFARLNGGCSQAAEEFGGHVYQFIRFEVDSVQQFKNFRMHSGLTLVAKSDEGELVRWRWLRAAVERKGAFKIYSTTD